jgi:hypothetical protein
VAKPASDRPKPLWRRKFLLPAWLVAPLVWLGLVYLARPLGTEDLYGYGFALFVAALFGLWVRSRYRVTVLERSERGVVLWLRWTNKTEQAEPPPPVIVADK